MVGALICDAGGEPPVEEKSELLLGESGRLSGVVMGLSSHCYDVRSAQFFNNDKGGKKRTEGNPPLIVLFLRGDWFKVSGLYWDWAGTGGEVE